MKNAKNYTPKAKGLRLDLEAIHKARRKLQILQSAVKSELKGEESEFTQAFCEIMSLPTPHECKVLLDLIQDAENVLYPSFQEISMHDYHLSMLTRIDPENSADQFNEIADKISEYEQKFCK